MRFHVLAFAPWPNLMNCVEGSAKNRMFSRHSSLSLWRFFRRCSTFSEEHAPTWYTEEHHRRAVAALGALQKSRPLGKAEAARSQKVGK